MPIAPKEGRQKPKRIEFPEDRLIQSYYAKHPEAAAEPIDLTSFTPPTARRFALQQLALMQERGLTRKQAERWGYSNGVVKVTVSGLQLTCYGCLSQKHKGMVLWPSQAYIIKCHAV